MSMESSEIESSEIESSEIDDGDVEVKSVCEALRNRGYYVCPYDAETDRVIQNTLMAREPIVHRAAKLAIHFIVEESTLCHRVLTTIIPKSCMTRWLLESPNDYFDGKILSETHQYLKGQAVTFEFFGADTVMEYNTALFCEGVSRAKWQGHFEIKKDNTTPKGQMEDIPKRTIVISDGTIPKTPLRRGGVSITYVPVNTIPPDLNEEEKRAITRRDADPSLVAKLQTREMGAHLVIVDQGEEKYLGFPLEAGE